MMESNGITHYVPKIKGNYSVHCWLSTCKSQGAKTAVILTYTVFYFNLTEDYINYIIPPLS